LAGDWKYIIHFRSCCSELELKFARNGLKAEEIMFHAGEV
jgi:hypothetical protein